MLCELCVGLGHDTVDGSEIWHPPVEVGSLSHYLQSFITSLVQEFFHQQFHQEFQVLYLKWRVFRVPYFQLFWGVGSSFT